MAKFYGKLGFAIDREVRPSVWESLIEERFYVGDTLKNYARQENADRPVDNANLGNDISVVADPYALNHFASMKYVEFMGVKWEVQSVTVEYPRLRISFGGAYHGPTPETARF